MLSLSRGFYLVVAASIVISLPLFGQTGLGSVTGEVVDSTGAKLPHANLELVENSTQTTFTTAANAEGILFSHPSLWGTTG